MGIWRERTTGRGGGGVEGMKFYEYVISKNFFLAGHE